MYAFLLLLFCAYLSQSDSIGVGTAKDKDRAEHQQGAAVSYADFYVRHCSCKLCSGVFRGQLM